MQVTYTNPNNPQKVLTVTTHHTDAIVEFINSTPIDQRCTTQIINNFKIRSIGDPKGGYIIPANYEVKWSSVVFFQVHKRTDKLSWGGRNKKENSLTHEIYF